MRIVRVAIATTTLAAVAGASFWAGRSTAPGAPGTGARALPPVKSALPGHRPERWRAPTVPEVEAKIAELSARGFWRYDKEWELIINGIGPAEIAALLPAVEKVPIFGIRRSLRASFLRRWAEESPPGAMRYADTLGDQKQRDLALRDALRGWAYVRTDEMVAWTRQLPPGPRRDIATTVALEYLDQKNPPQALQLIRDLNVTPRIPTAAPNVYGAWASMNPVAAAAHAEAHLTGSQRSDALAKIGDAWAADDPQAALRWAARLPEGREQNTVTQAILTEWLQAEPAAVAEYVLQMRAGEARNTAIGTVAMYWGYLDPSAATRWVERLPDSGVKHTAREKLLWQLVRRDAGRGLAYAASLPAGSARTRLLTTAVNYAAGQNPAAAFAFVQALPSGKSRDELRQTLFSRWTQDEPRGAFQAVAAMAPGPERDRLMKQALPHLARVDAEAAMAAVQTLPSEAARTEAIAGIVTQLAPNDPQMALAYFAGLPEGVGKHSAIPALARGLAIHNPADALSWLQNMPAGELKASAVRAAARILGATDPKATIELCAAARSSLRNLEPEIVQIAQTWAENDLSSAVAWLRQTDNPQKTAAAQGLRETWVRADPEAALSFALSIPDEQQRHSLATQYARSWSNTDSRAAAAWAVQLPQDQASHVAASIATSLTHQSVEEAIRFASTIRGEEAQSIAVRALMAAWSVRNADAILQAPESVAPNTNGSLPGSGKSAGIAVMQQWVDSLPGGSFRSAAAEGFVQQTRYDTPQLAASYVAQIVDSKRRETAAERVAQSWLRKDRAAALAWMEQMGFTAEQRQRAEGPNQYP